LADIKKVYQTITEEEALQNLMPLKKNGGNSTSPA